MKSLICVLVVCFFNAAYADVNGQFDCQGVNEEGGISEFQMEVTDSGITVVVSSPDSIETFNYVYGSEDTFGWVFESRRIDSEDSVDKFSYKLVKLGDTQLNLYIERTFFGEYFNDTGIDIITFSKSEVGEDVFLLQTSHFDSIFYNQIPDRSATNENAGPFLHQCIKRKQSLN